jgi:hypothetical protein
VWLDGADLRRRRRTQRAHSLVLICGAGNCCQRCREDAAMFFQNLFPIMDGLTVRLVVCAVVDSEQASLTWPNSGHGAGVGGRSEQRQYH